MNSNSGPGWASAAAVLGTAWLAFFLTGLAVTLPFGLLTPSVFPRHAPWPPVLLLVLWFVIAGFVAGIASGLALRTISGAMPAGLVGLLVALYAFVQYRYIGTVVGPWGEQGIRLIGAGLSSALGFSWSSRRPEAAAA